MSQKNGLLGLPISLNDSKNSIIKHDIAIVQNPCLFSHFKEAI
jgi:hypothetical protein